MFNVVKIIKCPACGWQEEMHELAAHILSAAKAEEARGLHTDIVERALHESIRKAIEG